MKKILLFCLCITPAIITAAANNNAANLKAGQLYLFNGKRALQQGNFERAKSLFQKSAALGYPGAIEALANLQQIFAERNQQQAHPGIIVERSNQ